MQTILGAGGAIANELAKALTSYTTEIRLVSRNPMKVNPGDAVVAADVLNRGELENAVRGTSVVYVTVGFPYDLKTWRENWPKLIGNLVALSKQEKFKLVFFDNVYMYDKDHFNPMVETAPINPSSKKGRVRAELDKTIMDAVRAGEIQALIARSADYYGPGAKNNSVLYQTVIKPLSEGKKATLLGGENFKHSYTFTPDAGKATAILGNSDRAYGQVWHLPTAKDPFTGKKWVESFAKAFDVAPKYRVISSSMLKLMGLFSSQMREISEMNYQNDRDYVFDSGKFEREFDFSPTPYQEGIGAIMRQDYATI